MHEGGEKRTAGYGKLKNKQEPECSKHCLHWLFLSLSILLILSCVTGIAYGQTVGNAGKDYIFNNIQTSAGIKSITVTSYYNEVQNLTFSNGTITFRMPFSWHSENASLVHMELKFPKTIPELHANSYYGSINGIALPERALLIDDYSSSEFRIVHFVISRPILDMLSGKVPAGSTEMLFSLSPAGTPKFPIDVQSLPAGKYVFELSWGPRVIRTGVLTTFAMNLQDVKTGDLSRDTGFDFVLRHNGTEVFRQKEYSSIGVYSEQYTFQDTGLYQLSAENINGQGETSQLDLQVLQGNGTTSAPSPQSTSNTKPSGCLIATAAFGSELTPQVQYLRNFRDQFVMKSESGSAFMTSFDDVYYSFSPQVADYEREHPALQMTIRGLIYPLLGILVLSESAHHLVGGELGTMLAGGIAASIIGATYLWPAGAVIPYRAKSKWFVMSVIVASVIMAASLLIIPSILMYTTSAFVVISTASGAVLVPRAVKSILVK